MALEVFGNDNKAWMVNFRVRNLEPMVAQLRGAGISVEIDPQRNPNGRFARLYDPVALFAGRLRSGTSTAAQLWTEAIVDGLSVPMSSIVASRR